MAVYDRAWRAYEGPRTPPWSRFLVLPRYAWRGLFRSRLFTMFFALCFVWPVLCAVGLYLRHNLKVLESAGISPQDMFPVDTAFFLVFLIVQTFSGFLLALAVGPSLVSPDLANNGLALYLCRPFSRWEYFAGKAVVLAALLSAVTWVPGFLLLGIQTSLEKGWLASHARIPVALFLASWVWILLLSLLSLALSAYVRRRAMARILLLAVFFLSSGLAEAVNELLNTRWGFLLGLGDHLRTIWVWLFEPARLDVMADLPVPAAWAGLLAVCAFCVWLLHRKLRAYEVVR